MTLELVFLAFSAFGMISATFVLLSGRHRTARSRDDNGRMSGPLPVAGFIIAFGLAGFLVSRLHGTTAILSVPTAVAAGLGGAWLSGLLPMHDDRERDSPPARSEIVGTVGRLSLPIRETGVGELVYSDGGSKQISVARSQDGRPIEKGVEVLVTRVENGVAVVRRLEDVLPGVRRAVRRIESASAEQVSRRARTSC